MKVFALSVFVTMAGCAMDNTSARSVSVKPGKGGVVTLSPHEDPRARSKADAIMTQTCSGKKPEITEEGDVVVGTATKSNTEHRSGAADSIKVAGFGFGGASPTSETEAVAKNVTEWRITYECK